MSCSETCACQYYSESLIKKAQNNDREAMDILIKQNMPLVTSLVKKYYFSKDAAEDLCQIGAVGLIKAIKRFDFSYNTRFSTYAVHVINGEIKRHFRDDGYIKVSRQLKSIYLKVKNEERRLLQLGEEKPNLYLISQKINEQYEDVCMAIKACSVPEYLDGQAYNDDNSGKTKLELVYSDRDDTDKTVDLIDLKNAILRLDKEKRQIITLRYFKNMTQSEVAKIMGVSQVQVSRIEKKTLNEIKNNCC